MNGDRPGQSLQTIHLLAVAFHGQENELVKRLLKSSGTRLRTTHAQNLTFVVP